MGGIILAALIGCGGIILAFVSLDVARRRRLPAPNQADLWMQSFGSTVRAEELELNTPFEERILAPIVRSLRGYLVRHTAEGQRQSLEHLLDQAGRPAKLSATDVALLRYAFGVVGLAVSAYLFLPRLNVLLAVVLVVGLTALGFISPWLWLRQLASSRRSQIRKALPDAIDLMVISVEAGLSLEGAFQQVGGKLKGKSPLGDEFERVLTEIHLGNTRQEALMALAKRSELDDLNNLVQSLAQSEQMGVPIARMLRTHAESLRTTRRQRAQEKGGRAGLLMLFPMIGCIFPTIWIILVGPALLILIASGHI
jgi:tight adherence protein C